MTHHQEYLIPINFSLTDAAREHIRTTIQRHREETGTEAVAVMCWLQGGSDPDGPWQDFNFPCLGADERAKLPADAIQDLDGLELVFNVPRDVVAKFDGQLIDFTEGAGIHFVGPTRGGRNA